MAPERQKEFIDEVFEEIQFDQHGIRAVVALYSDWLSGKVVSLDEGKDADDPVRRPVSDSGR